MSGVVPRKPQLSKEPFSPRPTGGVALGSTSRVRKRLRAFRRVANVVRCCCALWRLLGDRRWGSYVEIVDNVLLESTPRAVPRQYWLDASCTLPPGWLLQTLPIAVRQQIRTYAKNVLVRLVTPLAKRFALLRQLRATLVSSAATRPRLTTRVLRDNSSFFELWPEPLLAELLSKVKIRAYRPGMHIVFPISRQGALSGAAFVGFVVLTGTVTEVQPQDPSGADDDANAATLGNTTNHLLTTQNQSPEFQFPSILAETRAIADSPLRTGYAARTACVTAEFDFRDLAACLRCNPPQQQMLGHHASTSAVPSAGGGGGATAFSASSATAAAAAAPLTCDRVRRYVNQLRHAIIVSHFPLSTATLRRSVFFRGWDENDLAHILEGARPRTFFAGEEILTCGAAVGEVSVVVRGRAVVSARCAAFSPPSPSHRTPGGGISAGVAAPSVSCRTVLAPGDVFGEVATVCEEKSSMTIVSEGICDLWIVSRATILLHVKHQHQKATSERAIVALRESAMIATRDNSVIVRLLRTHCPLFRPFFDQVGLAARVNASPVVAGEDSGAEASAGGGVLSSLAATTTDGAVPSGEGRAPQGTPAGLQPARVPLQSEKELLDSLASVFRPKVFGVGERVVSAGDNMEFLAVVVSGRINESTAAGYVLFPAPCIIGATVWGHEKWPHSLIALKYVECWVASRRDLIRVLRLRPLALTAILQTIQAMKQEGSVAASYIQRHARTAGGGAAPAAPTSGAAFGLSFHSAPYGGVSTATALGMANERTAATKGNLAPLQAAQLSKGNSPNESFAKTNLSGQQSFTATALGLGAASPTARIGNSAVSPLSSAEGPLVPKAPELKCAARADVRKNLVLAAETREREAARAVQEREAHLRRMVAPPPNPNRVPHSEMEGLQPLASASKEVYAIVRHVEERATPVAQSHCAGSLDDSSSRCAQYPRSVRTLAAGAFSLGAATHPSPEVATRFGPVEVKQDNAGLVVQTNREALQDTRGRVQALLAAEWRRVDPRGATSGLMSFKAGPGIRRRGGNGDPDHAGAAGAATADGAPAHAGAVEQSVLCSLLEQHDQRVKRCRAESARAASLQLRVENNPLSNLKRNRRHEIQKMTKLGELFLEDPVTKTVRKFDASKHNHVVRVSHLSAHGLAGTDAPA